MDLAHALLRLFVACFPRRRGDGPRGADPSRIRRAFSPQARGWTDARLHRIPGGEVFPAGAGMDPTGFTPRQPRGGFPRRRGDGPTGQEDGIIYHLFSPQARGWTRYTLLTKQLEQVFPAGAGMDPYHHRGGVAEDSFPRRRGDGPAPRRISIGQTLFSPQARGWTFCGSYPRLPPSVFPAGAGMDPGQALTGQALTGFPRRRGDGPYTPTSCPLSTPFSPQARGWTFMRIVGALSPRVFPAGAGMDRSSGHRSKP